MSRKTFSRIDIALMIVVGLIAVGILGFSVVLILVTASI